MLSPDLLATGPPLRTAADLPRYTLLHETNRDCWARWLEAAGSPNTYRPERGPIFGDGSLTTHAAALGHGVALGDPFINGADLRDGTLVEPFRDRVPFGSYWLVAPDLDALSEPARAFADWLVAEIKARTRVV